MSFRIEDKLYIKSENVSDFKQFLSKIKAKEIYEPRKINSLYFDNISLDMYRDSIEGSSPRKKIRVREYPGTSDNKYYLEVKTSSVEGRYKKRKEISKSEFDIFKHTGILDDQYGTCMPNYYVSYLREYALVEDVRVSIDTNILYKNFNTNTYYNDNNSIIELKTSASKNLDDLIKDFPFQRIRFSKYCFAVENLR